MKKTDQKYTVAIIISLILGASILGYGYLDYKFKKDALESNRQEAMEEAARKKENYNECVLGAELHQQSWWNRSCEEFGHNKKTDGCTLPSYIADDINAKRDKDIQNCVTLYK